MAVDSWYEGFIEEGPLASIVQSSNGQLVVNGTVITGLASYTAAEFISGSFDLTVARHVKVIDWHSANNGTSTPGSLWWIDPTAVTARKRQLVSGPIWNSSYASLLSTFPAASWPGMQARAADVGKGTVILEERSGRYVAQGGQGFLLQEVNGTVATPTKTLPGTAGAPQLFALSNSLIPANLIQQGDLGYFTFSAQRHQVGSMTIVCALGKSTTALTDAAMWTSAIATTDLAKVEGVCKLEFGSATVFTTNGTQGIQQTGGSGAGPRVDASANFDLGFDQYIKIGLSVKGTSTDTLDLLQASFLWVPAL